MTTRQSILTILRMAALFEGLPSRSFDITGPVRERGSFKCWPPRSMTEWEKQYYAKYKNLDYN